MYLLLFVALHHLNELEAPFIKYRLFSIIGIKDINIKNLTRVKMSEPSVLEIVTFIFQDPLTETQKKEKYQSIYPVFIENHPILFEMACKKDFDFVQFQRMIQLKNSVDNGSITQHDASVKIGTQLFNTYVKNKLP